MVMNDDLPPENRPPEKLPTFAESLGEVAGGGVAIAVYVLVGALALWAAMRWLL